MLSSTVTIQTHDYLVEIDHLVGINRQSFEQRMAGGYVRLCKSPEDAVNNADIVVITHRDTRYQELTQDLTVPVLDCSAWKL